MATNTDGELKIEMGTTERSGLPYRYRIPETAGWIEFPAITVAAGATNTAITLPEDYSASTAIRMFLLFIDPNDSGDLVIKVSGSSNQSRPLKPLQLITDKPSSIHVTNSDASNAATLKMYGMINTATAL